MIMNGGKICPAMSSRAYHRLITGEGKSHKELAKEKVDCGLCGTTVCRAYLKRHQDTPKCIHGRKEYSRHHPPPPPEPTELALVEMPPMEYCIRVNGTTQCPVEGCPKVVHDASSMRKHFRDRHNSDTIEIEGEG
jgi:hypothetical protein